MSDSLEGASPKASPRSKTPRAGTPRDEWAERVWMVFDSIEKGNPDHVSWDEFFLFWQNTGLRTGA